MDVLVRLFVWLGVGGLCEALCNHSGSKAASYFNDKYHLRPSVWSKVSMAPVIVGPLVFFLMTWYSPDFEKSGGYLIFWSVAALTLLLLTIGYLSAKYSYDDEYLYIHMLLRSYQYEWSALVKIKEYRNSAAGILILKFSNRWWWVGVPSDFEGSEQLRYHARQYVPWRNR